ncbi:hypothetical protein [Methylobacterium platani]|nr:hypothetical protein [Methylobacterium platani]
MVGPGSGHLPRKTWGDRPGLAGRCVSFALACALALAITLVMAVPLLTVP